MTITAQAAYHVVEPPSGVPPRFGLASVLSYNDADPHEGLGVTWVSQSCSTAGLTNNDCVDPGQAALTPDPACAVATAEPFTVYLYDTDSIVGVQPSAHREQLRNRFLVAEASGVELAVSTSLLALATPFTNTLGGTDIASKLLCALGLVEQEVGLLTGNEGVIHLPKWILPLVANALSEKSGVLRTTAGTPVAAYASWAGYTAGAVPTTAEIYGTGPMLAHRGQAEYLAGTPDLKLNDIDTIAQRTYVVGWDCGAVAVNTTL